jgi:hypothetical protein
MVSLLIGTLAEILDQESIQRETNAQPGTLKYAWEQLELYLNLLDNRIVGHFDTAADSKDLAAMAYYARIMSLAHRNSAHGSSVLMSRYISRHSMFVSPNSFFEKVDLEESSISDTHAMMDSEAHLEASRRIVNGCRLLADAIREEASVLEQLFEESEKAISLFITRVFEEIVSKMISLAFQFAKFGQEKDSRMLRDSLRLIAESYRKTLNLADEACQMIRNQQDQHINPVDLADGAMGTILVYYPALEKKWNIALGTSTITHASKDDFNVETAMSLIAINEESLKRCVQILDPNDRTEFVQQLFYTPVVDEINSGPSMSSLLDYLGTFIIGNLDHAKTKYLRCLDTATFWRDADAKPVEVRRGMEGSVGMLLQSVSVAVQCVQASQSYFRNSVEPIIRLHSEPCEDALKGLEKAIEHQISIELQGCQQKFVDKMMEMLSYSQSKADFSADSANANAIESPTQACLKACLVMKELIATCRNHLVGKNFEIFLKQLARQLENSIEMHLLKYYYTPGGALRMRRDLGEYSACLEDPENPSRQPPLQDLRAMSNILIVSPSSVQEMIHSVSYLDKMRIKRLLERRYDYRSLPSDLLNSL